MTHLYAFGRAYLRFWRDKVFPVAVGVFIGIFIEAAAVYLLRTHGFH